jgi:hypothetical protein
VNCRRQIRIAGQGSCENREEGRYEMICVEFESTQKFKRSLFVYSVMAVVPNADPNHDSYKWNQFIVLDPAHPSYILPDGMQHANLEAFSVLTLKDIGGMTAAEIRELYADNGLPEPTSRVLHKLRNQLLAATTTAAQRVQAAIQALGVGAITTEERRHMKQMEERLATLEKRNATNDDINMRPAKRPHLVTEGKVRELVVGETAEDGTFALVENVRDPLRGLFFGPGGYGYTTALGDPPSDKALAKYLEKRDRIMAKALPLAVVSKVANFEWAKIDLADFASEGLESVTSDKNCLYVALDNFIGIVEVVHGEAIGKRAKEFGTLLRTKNTAENSVAMLLMYFKKCMKHFTADLQDAHDKWVARPAGASLDITIPKIGHSVHVTAASNIADSVERKRIAELETRMMAAAKEMVVKALGGGGGRVAAGGTGLGGGGTPGATKVHRKINAANIPNDSKGKRLCVANSEPRGCKAGASCKWSHERKIGEKDAKELDKVFEF